MVMKIYGPSMENPFDLRRYFALTVMGSLFFSSFANAALDSVEQETVNQMKERGVANFLLLNKAKGNLVIVENGKEKGRIPALSGKHRGDTLQEGLSITPSGVFPLSPENNPDEPYPAIAFYKQDNSSYVIHPVSGARVPKLLGGTAEDKRVTAGCINVAKTKFRQLFAFASTHQEQIFHDEQGQPIVAGNFLVVMKESSPAHKLSVHP
jgi:hypothetical protein